MPIIGKKCLSTGVVIIKFNILGLRCLKSILLQGHYELRVDLEDTSGNQLYAQYDVLDLGSQVDQYPLFVDGYVGTAGGSTVCLLRL